MKPGDLVKQASSIYNDFTAANQAMLVLEVTPIGIFGGASVRVLFKGKKRWWLYEELEIVNEAR